MAFPLCGCGCGCRFHFLTCTFPQRRTATPCSCRRLHFHHPKALSPSSVQCRIGLVALSGVGGGGAYQHALPRRLASALAIAMAPLSAADAFLVLEFTAGNRDIPHALFASLRTSLLPLAISSASPRSSPRLRKALVLRALHGALHTDDASCSITLLGKARRLLANPQVAACFPHPIPFADEEIDGARAVADLKRLLDHEWDKLPPSTLELAADRVAGDGALQTWATADHAERSKLGLLVGKSTESEILAKLTQGASTSHPPILPGVDDNANDPNARQYDWAGPSNENSEVDHAQGGMAGHQNASVKGAESVQQKSVPALKKSSLLEKNPNASTYEWHGLGDSVNDPVGKRILPHFGRKPIPSPPYGRKVRKKWSEIEAKTLELAVESGLGWKDIKLAYPDVFEGRSEVDLKDKHRNMLRSLPRQL